MKLQVCPALLHRHMAFKSLDECLFLLFTEEKHSSLFDPLNEVTSFDHIYILSFLSLNYTLQERGGRVDSGLVFPLWWTF